MNMLAGKAGQSRAGPQVAAPGQGRAGDSRASTGRPDVAWTKTLCCLALTQPHALAAQEFQNNAETRDRTGDLQIFSLTLSQLSYRGSVTSDFEKDICEGNYSCNLRNK